jgi:hypothetical protein
MRAAAPLAIALLALLLSSCVSQQQYDAVEQENQQ